jgi:predicted nucleic-acid-binding protein
MPKKIGLDTSVVLRLLLGQPEDQALRAQAYLDRLARRGDQPVASDLVVAEAYFALQHHYGVPKKEALQALRQMFAAGEIIPTGTAADVLAEANLATAKPGFVDRMIHNAYTADCGTMATFEQAAAKLSSVEVL